MSKKATKRNRRKLRRRWRELNYVFFRQLAREHVDGIVSSNFAAGNYCYANNELPSLDAILRDVTAIQADLVERLALPEVSVAHWSRLSSLDLAGVRRIELNPDDLADFEKATPQVSAEPTFGIDLSVFGMVRTELVSNSFLPRGHLRFEPPAHLKEGV